MHIIEIKAADNGSHRNQEYNGAIPPHWEGVAFIREDVSTLENFPFGNLTVEEINGVMTVTAWEAGEMPEPEPIVEEPTLEEDTAAMLIDHEFRLTLLELGITE